MKTESPAVEHRTGADRIDIKAFHGTVRLLPRLFPRRIRPLAVNALFKAFLFYGKNIRPSLGTPSERTLEYSWVLEKLGRGTHRVLDVGCGDSLILAELLKRGFKVSAIDMMDQPIARTMPNVTFRQGDIRDMPFEDGYFDQMISISVMEHITEDTLAMREISRALKADGTVLITVPFGNFNKTDSYRSRAKILDMQVDNLRLITEEYYVTQGKTWTKMPAAGIDETVASLYNPKTIACLTFRKGAGNKDLSG